MVELIVAALEALGKAYAAIRADAAQSAAKTDAEWAALDSRVDAAMKTSAWKTDDQA